MMTPLKAKFPNPLRQWLNQDLPEKLMQHRGVGCFATPSLCSLLRHAPGVAKLPLSEEAWLVNFAGPTAITFWSPVRMEICFLGD